MWFGMLALGPVWPPFFANRSMARWDLRARYFRIWCKRNCDYYIPSRPQNPHQRLELALPHTPVKTLSAIRNA